MMDFLVVLSRGGMHQHRASTVIPPDGFYMLADMQQGDVDARIIHAAFSSRSLAL
jgi:hypothetical protein